ncbi:hypothetical protein DL770_003688 [Monosporascus sp. CRB-9-2]|nr:hypothetical protein DL770_003688 [Monosporascus sp. CRB-9-2]
MAPQDLESVNDSMGARILDADDGEWHYVETERSKAGTAFGIILATMLLLLLLVTVASLAYRMQQMRKRARRERRESRDSDRS